MRSCSRPLCFVLLACLVLWGIAACGLLHPFGAVSDTVGSLHDHAAVGEASGAGPHLPVPGSGQAQVLRILTVLIWATIVGGVVSLLASFVLPVIPTKASAGSILLGVGLAYLKDILIDYGWAVKLAFGACALVFAWPYITAALRWRTARKTGKPIKGNTGWAAIRSLWPFGAKRGGQSNHLNKKLLTDWPASRPTKDTSGATAKTTDVESRS